LKRWWLALCAPLVMAACGEESPTDAGAALLPPNVVRTFEIILDPSQYLAQTASFSDYTDVRDLDFAVIANTFEGALNSNAVARFFVPGTVSLVDTAGAARLDTVPALIGGTVTIRVDTLRSTDGPVRLALYRTTEQWDASANWLNRTDTAGVRIPWTMPGGTRGVLVDTASFDIGSDTVRFSIDSATVASWRDTANAGRGALIVAQTPGARLFTTVPTLTVDMRSSMRPDTVYQVTGGTTARTFLFEPILPTPVAEPRAGGTPAWRGVIQLRERLDTVSFACPGVPNCRYRLADVTINYAGLRLQPMMPPPGFSPEDDLTIAAYLMAPTPQVPLQRSPLRDLIGVAVVPRTSFLAPEAPVFELSVTDMIVAAAMRPEIRGDAFLPTHLALVSGLDFRTFGFATFETMPRLRLVVSIAQEMQLP
jgi:hypothetical protein